MAPRGALGCLAALTAALLAAAAQAAEGAAVEVQVLARGTREPLAGASVLVDGAHAGETDEAGRIALTLGPGRHVVQVQFPGHAPLTATIEAGAGPVALRLEPAGDGPRYETVVRRPPVEAPRVTVEREEATRMPGGFGDPFRVIESLPGVAPIVWPLPVYAVRGANPGNTGFLVDGLRVPALFHFALGPAVIHPHFLERIDFYAGGYPARHGRYVGGLVEATTAAPPGDRVRGSVDLRLFDAGGMLSAPIPGGSVAVAGRYAFPAALYTALQNEVEVEYWDYQARLDRRLGPGRLTLFALGSHDLLEPKVIEGRQDALDRLVLRFHRLSARWRGGAGPGALSADVAAGLDQTTAPFDNNALTARAQGLSARLGYALALGAVDLEVGSDGELQDYAPELGVAGPAAAAFARSRVVRQGGAYASAVARLGQRLVLSPGVRVEGYSEGDARALDVGPRLQIRVRAADPVWLKASGGRFSQMPSLPLQLPGFEGFGLADLGLQRAWQGAVGVEAEPRRGLVVDASLFAQRYDLTDVRDPELGDPLLDDFLIRRPALSYGLELMARRPPSERLHGWISYTLSRALRAFEGGVVGPADWDQRHVLNLVAGYRVGRWTLGGRFHLHTGRPVKVENTTPPEFARLPAFYQVDARVERRVLFDRFVLDVYLELVNASLTDQVIRLRRTGGGIQPEGFRLVLPSLGLRAQM